VICLAYLDLGTGSFLLQLAMAGCLGAVYFFKAKVARLVAFLRRKKDKPPK